MNDETLHIYTRVSTDAQEEKGTSLETQKSLGIQAATALGLGYRVWNEGGASSYHENLSNRPVLLDLMRLIEAGQVHNLWVFNNDRLSRNDVTAGTIKAALKKHNVILYTKDGKFDLSNPQDSLMKTILDGMAAFDNAMRADRTRLGKISKVRAGFWMGGPAPFGYRVVANKLELDPEESGWVHKIYDWYANGKSVQSIKSELDKNGVKTNRGKTVWSLGSISKILQNTHPSGRYTYTDAKTDETIVCECPAIVSVATWNACQDQRKKILERKGQNNRTKRFYLLRNLMYCGHCGSPMSARTKEAKHEFLYYCPRKERDWKNAPPKDADKWSRGGRCTMTKSLNIPTTDRFVWSNIIVDLFKSNFLQTNIKRALRETFETDNPELTIKKHRNALMRFKKDQEQTISNISDVETAKITGKQDRRIADGVIKNLNEILKEQDAKIAQLEFLIAELENKSDMGREVITRIGSKGIVTLNPDAVIDTHERKQLLERLIERIQVFYDKDANEHRLKLHFKIPLLETYQAGKPNDGALVLKKKSKGRP